jgi:hypothetical protein
MGGTIEVPGEVRAAFTGELIAPADPGYDQARQVAAATTWPAWALPTAA